MEIVVGTSYIERKGGRCKFFLSSSSFGKDRLVGSNDEDMLVSNSGRDVLTGMGGGDAWYLVE